MFRNQHNSNQHNSNHQAEDHRRDGEREDTAVNLEIPGPQASSTVSPPAGKASQGTTPEQLTPEPVCRNDSQQVDSHSKTSLQPNPRSSVLSEPWSPRKNRSLSSLRVIHSGAMGPTPEPPTTPIIPPRREILLVSTLYQYKEGACTKMVGTMVTVDSLSPPERSRIFRMKTIKRESAGTVRLTHTDLFALEEDRCAADTLQSSDEPQVCRPDGLNVDDVKTSGDPEEDAPTAQLLKECCDRIACTLQQRTTNSPSAVTLPGKDCSSGAQSTTAELPTTSKISNGREAPLVCRLHRYQNCKSTEFEEKKKDGESSSASTGLSRHPGPKTTVPPVGRDDLSQLLVQLSLLIIERLGREPAGSGRITHTGRTSSLRRNLLQGKSTAVAHEEDRCAADALQSSDEPRLDAKTSGEPEEHGQAAQLLERLCKRIQRLLEEISDKEKDEASCRICHGTDNSPTNPLTSPCWCKGSLKFIHIDCLKNWTRARIEMGLGPYSVQCCELCKGYLRLEPGTFNVHDFFRETQQQMLNDPDRYPRLAYLHRPSRFRRFILRVRGWMPFRRSS